MWSAQSERVMDGALWKIGGRTVDLSRKAMIMGVVNVTPDSFSDGGEFFDHDRAVEHALQMVSDGAHIIDVGGESTRPGSAGVSADEEMQRVLPVIEQVRARSDVLISIDTSKAEVARAALNAGASIINDVTGGRGDAQMFALATKSGAAFIIMHMQGEPRTMQLAPHYGDVLREVAEFFRQQFRAAITSGIDPNAIAFDPGIGFGKTVEHNLRLIANLPRLRVEERPLTVGVSRKSFLGKLIGSSDTSDRVAATVGMTAFLRARGANVLRVHDVKANASALRVTEAALEVEE